MEEMTEKTRQKVKYGIIGVGNMGSAHLDNFMNGKIADSVVTAVADIDRAKLDRVKNKYPSANFEYYQSGEDLIEKSDADAVIIAVPHYFHSELAISAMRRHKHVICEKPAGVYTKQVKEMNAEADKSDVLFTVMFNQRTNCVYRKMREIILSGGIGFVKRINWIITDWYRNQAYYDSGEWRATWDGEGGGLLLNQCPHQLDLIQWVTGMTPKTVRAFCSFGKWHDIETEDDVTAYFEYENGATGVFVTSTADAPGVNRFQVTGSLGSIVCDGNELKYIRNDEDERKFCFEAKDGFLAPKCEEIKVETDGKNPQHVGIIENFTEAILGREPLFVKGQEGLMGVELMDACLLSEWLGKSVELPIDDDLYLEELDKRRKASRKKAVKSCKPCVSDLSGTYGGQSAKSEFFSATANE